jgi:hypothetical protein
MRIGYHMVGWEARGIGAGPRTRLGRNAGVILVTPNLTATGASWSVDMSESIKDEIDKLAQANGTRKANALTILSGVMAHVRSEFDDLARAARDLETARATTLVGGEFTFHEGDIVPVFDGESRVASAILFEVSLTGARASRFKVGLVSDGKDGSAKLTCTNYDGPELPASKATYPLVKSEFVSWLRKAGLLYAEARL